MSSPKLIRKAKDDGKKAFEAGLPPECPDSYTNSDERLAWFEGYYETELVQKHQKTFEKYGIKYP